MMTAPETELSDRKVTAMVEWAALLTGSAHDALARMSTTLTLAEAKIAMVREIIARRDRELGLRGPRTDERVRISRTDMFTIRAMRDDILEEGNAMARKAEEWGECQGCKWFQVEPGASAENNTMGLCIEESLQRFRLRVSGNSGCNGFVAGDVAHAKESGSAPPTAKTTR